MFLPSLSQVVREDQPSCRLPYTVNMTRRLASPKNWEDTARLCPKEQNFNRSEGVSQPAGTPGAHSL